MKTTRKPIAVLLVVLLLALSCGALSLTAQAKTEIGHIAVLVQQPLTGKHPSFDVVLPADAHCSVELAEWRTGTSGHPGNVLSAADVFADGGTYVFCLWLKPDSGYSLPGADDAGSWIQINGSRAWSAAYNTITFALEYRANFTALQSTKLSHVSVSLQNAVVGKQANPPVVNVTPGFSIRSAYIQSNESGKWAAAAGAFREDVNYRLDLSLETVAGYTYADKITATVNGEEKNLTKLTDGTYRLYYYLPEPLEPAEPDPPPGGTTESDEDKCPWCGEVHGDGFFQKIVAWFHGILAKLFRR